MPSNQKLRAGLFTQRTVPTPKRLMNTAIAPQALDATYARRLENMLPDQGAANALAQRYGFVTLGDAISDNFLHVMEFRNSSGAIELLAYTDNGDIIKLNEGTGAWSTLYSGLTTDVTPQSITYADALVIYNGVDNNLYYDGSSVQEFSEKVAERLTGEWVDENTFKVFSSVDRTSRYTATDPIDIVISGTDLAITSITRSGTTATVTTTANHNLSTGTLVDIAGANQPEYNGQHEITSTGANTFTYTVSGTPATPATAATATIKAFKSANAPIYQERDIGSEKTQFDFFRTSDKAVGLKFVFTWEGLSGTTLEGDVLFQYRAAGDTDWITFRTFTEAGRTPTQQEIVELNNLEQGEYEARAIFDVEATSLELFDRFTANALPDGATASEIIIVASEDTTEALPSDTILAVSSITRTGDTATVTTADDHGLESNDIAYIFDVEEVAYSGAHEVTVTGTTTFTFTVRGTPSTPATVRSTLGSGLRYSFTGVRVDTTVSSSSYSSANKEITVNLTDNVFPAANVVIDRVRYTDRPPPFSHIYVHKDRMWALAAGRLKATTFKTADRTKVYYNDLAQSLNAWFNPTTQAVAYVDTGTKFNSEEELVTITSIEGYLVFMGREALQIWTGSDPSIEGDLAYLKTVPVGCVHRDLVQRLSRDVLFITEYGPRSLRKIFQTEGADIEADAGEAIDPTIISENKTLTVSDTNYRKGKSFAYMNDGFYGFKLSDNGTYAYIVTEEAKGWVLLTGFFADADTFLSTSDNRLLAAVGTQLYMYANGIDGSAVSYSDNGTAYQVDWWTGWYEGGTRWANIYIELLFEDSNVAQNIEIWRYTNNQSSQPRVLQKTIAAGASLWDVSLWDSNLWDTGELRQTVRDKFIANNYAYRIRKKSTDGPFRLSGFRTHGRTR